MILAYDPNLMVFVDETHVSQLACRRLRGWARAGIRPVVLEPVNDRRFSAIAACKGFITDACEVFELGTKRRGVDQNTWDNWFIRHLLPQLGSHSRREPRSILIMDNAATHGDRQHVMSLVWLKRPNSDDWPTVIMLPMYSPDFNPIEPGFSNVKACLKRHNQEHTSNPQATTHDAFRSVGPIAFECFYRRAGYGILSPAQKKAMITFAFIHCAVAKKRKRGVGGIDIIMLPGLSLDKGPGVMEQAVAFFILVLEPHEGVSA